MSGLATLELELTCDTPTRIGGIGADVRRDWAGRPCIPATTLKGRARVETSGLALSLSLPVCTPRAACDLRPANAPCTMCRLFGNRRVEGDVYFADLIADAEPVLIESNRMAHSRVRGVALDPDGDREQFRVLALPAGTHCKGTVHHRIAESENWQLALLVLGLRAIAQIGAGAGIGQGLCRIDVRNVPLNVLSAALQARVG